MKIKLKLSPSMKATGLISVWYLLIGIGMLLESALTTKLIIVISLFIFMLIGTGILWLGLRKYYQERDHKRELKHKYFRNKREMTDNEIEIYK